MHPCVPQTDVQNTFSVLILGGLGTCSQQNFLKIRCQKSEFGGILAYKVDFNITIIDSKGARVAMPNKSSHTASSQTTS